MILGIIKPAAFWFSTGFFTMILARSMCNSLDVYGLGGPRMYKTIEDWAATSTPVYYYDKTLMEQKRSYFAHDIDAFNSSNYRKLLNEHLFELEKDMEYEWQQQEYKLGRGRIVFYPPMWSLGLADALRHSHSHRKQADVKK